MDKQSLLDAIVKHFQHEYDVTVASAKHIYEAATHEDAKAENKYDTRALEASYLAESQSKRAMGIQQTINVYKALTVKNFADDETIALGALVYLEEPDGGHRYYFLGPRGGGTKVSFGELEVTILTGASPLGELLLGKEVGDEVAIGEREAPRTWEICAVY